MNVKLKDNEKVRVDNPDDLYEIMQRILLRENKFDREKEHFWIIGLNQNLVILYIELVSMGGVKSVTVEPMNVYRIAIHKGATRVIAVHNHPSGSLQQSEADEEITDRLIQVGKIIDISLEDHLIISTSSYMSFKHVGLMDKLSQSLKYVPPYVIIEQLKHEQRKILWEHEKAQKEHEKAQREHEKARKKAQQELKQKDKAIQIAVINLLQTMSVEQVAETLNLPVEEINKLSKKKTPKSTK